MVCDPDIWQIGEVVSCEVEESEGSGRVSVVLLRVSVTLNMNINEMIFKAPQMSLTAGGSDGKQHTFIWVTPPLYYSTKHERIWIWAFEATFKNWEKLIRDIFEDGFVHYSSWFILEMGYSLSLHKINTSMSCFIV